MSDINSKEVLYSKGKNDECMTLPYAVEPILPYIKDGDIVWCPFDNKDSEFVKQIQKTNTVVFSHLEDGSGSYNRQRLMNVESDGKDFFNYEPPIWDVLISNPPFTNKRKYFERAISFRKPFALIMSNTWLNDSAPKQLFKDTDLQLLMFDKRMKFRVGGEINKKITFSSSYFCWNFLPKQIIMSTFDEKNI